MKAVDMLGQEYDVGDYVVYATISGKSPVLKYAKVESISEKEEFSYSYSTRPPTAQKQLVPKIGVREIKNGRGFTRWDAWNPDSKDWDMSKVRVTYPNRHNIVKVNIELEPEAPEIDL